MKTLDESKVVESENCCICIIGIHSDVVYTREKILLDNDSPSLRIVYSALLKQEQHERPSEILNTRDAKNAIVSCIMENAYSGFLYMVNSMYSGTMSSLYTKNLTGKDY